MNTTLASSSFANSLPATSIATKPLWAAVGVLSICVLSMGATLVHVNKRTEPLAQASIPLASSLATNESVVATASTTPQKFIGKPAVVGKESAQTAPKNVAPTVAPVAASQDNAKPICKTCGTIEAVTPITKEGQGSGVGVIAGGVLGGVVGNQIGKGNGRAATTVLGAIGGGWTGNAIEKNMKKTTAYSVRIRMADGTVRTLEQSSAPLVGSKVTLDGNAVRPA